MKILCNGCSFTHGDGFLDHEREILSYPGLLSKNLSSEVINVAVPGSSNLEIFLRTIRETQNQHYDFVIVQWTELRRHWFEPCLGYIYRTAGSIDADWEHGIYLTKKDRKKFNEQLTLISGDYKPLLDLACFCQILKYQFGDKIMFINGLIDNLTLDLFSPLPANVDMFVYFDDFTKSLLEFDTKPDEDIKKYHQQLVDAFSPSLDRWLNIDNSWKKNIVDHATLGHHPGPNSHKWLADLIISSNLWST